MSVPKLSLGNQCSINLAVLPAPESRQHPSIRPAWPAGVYTQDGDCLLGTAVSNQIRVLANNDVPTGAAFIPLVVPVA